MKATKSHSLNPSEESIQKHLIVWFEWAYPNDRIFHIPNGGSRHKLEAINLKRLGVRPGVPDLFVPTANLPYHGLFLELKSKKGRLQPSQKDWLAYLEKQHYLCAAVYSFDEAIEVVNNYLKK